MGGRYILQNSTDEYYDEVNRILILIFILNIIVAAMKVITGTYYNILSMTSDGYDSFFDGISNITGILALSVARKPGDKEHKYGHFKIETLASIMIGIMLFFVSFKIITAAFDRLNGVGTVDVTLISFLILISTLIINLFVARYEHRKGVELKSDFLISDSKHTKTDVYATIVVLLGMVFMRLGLPVLDPVLSIIIALIIIKTAIGIMYDNINILMDKSIIEEDEIRSILMHKKEIIDIHNIRTRGTPAMVYLDMHMVLEGNLTIKEANEISKNCEHFIQKKIPEIKDILIHIESEEGIKDKIIYE